MIVIDDVCWGKLHGKGPESRLVRFVIPYVTILMVNQDLGNNYSTINNSY